MDEEQYVLKFKSRLITCSSVLREPPTGRGGNTNKTSTHEPTIEHHPHIDDGYKSTDRGEAGNFVKETS
jgi:hypothetical protein